jgi:hypothetical protein
MVTIHTQSRKLLPRIVMIKAQNLIYNEWQSLGAKKMHLWINRPKSTLYISFLAATNHRTHVCGIYDADINCTLKCIE